MNLDNIVCRDHLAWLTNDQAGDLDAWHVDDVPTLGTFGLEGGRVLFVLLDEPSDELTTWCYVPLSPEVAARLEGLDGC